MEIFRVRAGVLILATISLGMLAAPTFAGNVEPIELVPADSLLCWNSTPFPDTDRKADAPTALGTLLEAGARITGTPLKPRARLALRVAEAFALAIRYPFALVAIDASARPAERTPDSSVIDDLRIALIVQTGKEPEPFRRIIQKTLNDLTDSGQARIEKRNAGPYSYEELRDGRISEPFSWGEIGGCFVFGYGDGVWPTVAAVAEGKRDSLARVDWVRDARRDSPEPRLVEIYAAVKEIRRRLDPVAQERATEFFKSWNADKINNVAFMLGFEGRGLYNVANFVTDKGVTRHVYADAKLATPELLATVPDGARFAAYHLPMDTFLPRFFSGYYSTRGQRLREVATRVLNRIQEKCKFNVQDDVLKHLGDTVILHNEPPHPLRLPGAFTTLIPIVSDSEGVRGRLESLLEDWRNHLDEPDEIEGPATATLERDPDGVWSFRWGPLVGLAGTFTDRYIVLCWSPGALREYMDQMGDKLGKRPK